MAQHAVEQIDERSFLIGIQISRIRPVTGDAVVFVNVCFGSVRRVKRFHPTGRHPVGDKEGRERNDSGWNVTQQGQAAIDGQRQDERQHSQ